MKSRILLIDDNEATHAAIASVLTDRDYFLTTASNGAEGLSQFESQQYDLILLDYSLPDTDGLELLRTFVQKSPDTPVIIVTGSGSERIAVNALKTGACDYVVKSDSFISKLPHIIKDNLNKHKMRQRNQELEDQLRNSYQQLQDLNKQLEAKVENRTEELERAYQLSNELMAKAVDSNMQLAELYSEVDESRRKLDAQIRVLSLLNDVGKQLASTLDKDKLLQTAIDAARQELGVEHCAILLLNEETNRFRIGASWGTPDDLLLAARSLNGQQELLESIRNNKARLVQDVEADDKLRLLLNDFPGIESCILVPLCAKDLAIGIFTVYGYELDATLRERDLEFVSSLASQVSIALVSIFLIEQRMQEEQLDMLAKMTNYVMHESKSSLASIRNSTEHLSNDEIGAEKRKEFSGKIVTELDRILSTTQELLEFSHGQQGVLKLQTCTVQEFVQDIMSMLQQDFAAQNIIVHPNLQYTGNVEIDIEKMKRVFLNIADNARYAMPDGGTFTITSQLVDENVHFELIDEGSGISPDVQAHIFDPFVTERESNASGLGMTIVKKILDEHHARIELQSLFARGTTIRIMLPRHQQT